MNFNIWDSSESIRKYLRTLKFIKNFHIRTKEHDSLYSFYDNYIDIKVEIDEQIYIAEKLATGLDLEQQIRNIAGKYKVYFEFVDKVY
jgi:hypothetical protein